MIYFTTVAYKQHRQCEMDIYYKQPTQPQPVCLVVHGGAWMFGDKANTREQCLLLAEQMVVVSCNYRLSALPIGVMRGRIIWSGLIVLLAMHICNISRNIYICFIIFWCFVVYLFHVYTEELTPPEHIDDLQHVVKWIDKHIHRFQGLPQLFLLGHSAGAHLVSILGSLHPHIRGVICISGVYNLQRLHDVLMGDQFLRWTFGKQDDIIQHSPLHYVHEHTPPHLLINATWDFSLIKHTWDMLFHLREHNVYCESHVFPGNHMGIMKNWQNEHILILRVIQKFIQQIQTASRIK
jgi:acetyl esterase/lipase